MTIRIPAIALAVCLAAATTKAQDPATERMHEELRALRDGLITATNERNIELLLSHLHPNVVVTWQNAEVSRGHAGVREYLARMLSGPNPVVRAFSTSPTVDELTILYGGGTVGVAFGSSHDRFDLTDGTEFELNGRWSATLVHEGGRWLVANFHASTNLFDNAVLAETKRYATLGIAGGLILGAIIAGAVLMLLRRRTRRA